MFDFVKAPLKAGTEIGKISVYQEGVLTDTIPLILQEDCEKASVFDEFKKIAELWNFS